jgi:hypothetical protein
MLKEKQLWRVYLNVYKNKDDWMKMTIARVLKKNSLCWTCAVEVCMIIWECYYLDMNGAFYVLQYNIGDQSEVHLKLSMFHAAI